MTNTVNFIVNAIELHPYSLVSSINDPQYKLVQVTDPKLKYLFGVATFNLGILIFRANVKKIGNRIFITLRKYPH